VRTIEEWFLGDNTSLTSIDLSPLSNVTAIGDYFLGDDQSGITTVDLSPLVNLESTPGWFLAWCENLVSVVLPPNVKIIGPSFLQECNNLTYLDLSPLQNLNQSGISEAFIQDGHSLAVIDMGPFISVDNFEDGDAQGRPSLYRLNNPCTIYVKDIDTTPWQDLFSRHSYYGPRRTPINWVYRGANGENIPAGTFPGR
jgi:hypothetical protein